MKIDGLENAYNFTLKYFACKPKPVLNGAIKNDLFLFISIKGLEFIPIMLCTKKNKFCG